MKKLFSLAICISLFLFVSLILINDGKAGDSATPAELLSMVNALKGCKGQCENSKWTQANMTLNEVKKKYAAVLPQLVSQGDKAKVNSFGMLITKVSRSIQNHDRPSTQRNLKAMAGIADSFLSYYQGG